MSTAQCATKRLNRIPVCVAHAGNRAIGFAPVAFLIWVAFACPAPAANAQPRTSSSESASSTVQLTDRFQMTGFSQGMLEGITTAEKIIAANDSFEPAADTPTFQYIKGPSGDTGLRVFLVSSPSDRMPEICALWRDSANICDGNSCRTFDGRKAPLVVCNGPAMLALHTLFILEHASGAWEDALSSDAKFMAMLRGIDRDPKGTIATFQPDTTEHHLTDHWAMFMTFILGHEMGHWLESQAAGQQAGLDDVPTNKRLPPAVLCRNFDEYARHGWSLFGGAESPTQEQNQLPHGVALLDIEQTRSIWKSEVAADSIGVKQLARALGLISKTSAQKDYTRDLLEDFVGDIANLSLSLWYRRVDAFESATCPSDASRRFAMARCLCGGKGRWRLAADALLSDTHPPLLLRASEVIRGAVKAAKLEITPRISSTYLILEALQDGVIKIGAYGCTISQQPLLDAPLVSEFPALEGDRHRNPKGTYMLWPNPRERNELMRACIPEVTK